MGETRKIIYIYSAGHSGSTLLNMVLNAHSSILGLSEIVDFERYVREASNNPDSIILAEFWQKVIFDWERRTDLPIEAIATIAPNRKRFVAMSEDERTHYCEQNATLFDCIAESSGSRFLVDASKRWIRLKLLLQCTQLEIYVIHLKRDGCGVVNSHYRKSKRFIHSLYAWVGHKWRVPEIRALVERNRWLEVSYEQFASEPIVLLRDICAFLGVDYESSMLKFRSSEYYGIGGNRMRNSSLESIDLDEKWKVELGYWQKMIIKTISIMLALSGRS